MKPRMPPQPGLYPWMFVGAIIVRDQMQIEFNRRFAVNFLKETDKLLMPMTRHTVTDNLTIEHAEGGKQRGRTVALIIVSHRPATALLHGQTRLGSIESLDLALLVNAQHQGFVWRIQVQTHDIGQLLHKVFVPAKLKSFDSMWLQVVPLPYALHSHMAQMLCLGHAARAPMRSMGGFCMQSGFNNCANLSLGNLRNTTATRSILFQTWQTQSQKALPPQLYRGSGHSYVARNVLAKHAVGCHLNDSCTLHQSHRIAPSTRPCLQGRPFFWAQSNWFCGSHEPNHRITGSICQGIYVTLH